jgi:hypothetical protein
MESKCQIVSILSDSLVIQLKGANRHELETLVKDTDYRIKLAKWTEKRSLDANAYAWVLMTKIADAVGSSKEEIYENMLRSYGTIDDELPPIVVHSSADISKFQDHYLWFDSREINGKKFDCYLRIKGSSEMTSSEFSHFLDGIIFEAKNLGIEVMTPDQIAELKARWNDEINLTK